MRLNQVSIIVDRFNTEAKNGETKQTISVYADSNDIWTALTAAYYEIIGKINKDEYLPTESAHTLQEDKALIDFFLKHGFPNEWIGFVSEAREKEIERTKKRIEKGSQLHLELVKIANNVLYPNGSTRGISYNFLVKMIAGFSSRRSKES